MNRVSLLKLKSIQNWSWLFLVTYFTLAKFNIYFGILGLVCMLMPLYFVIKYRSKVHCSHVCPRGSFLGKFLKKFTLHNNLPGWMRTSFFKDLLLTMMIFSFSISLYKARGSYIDISAVIVTMMFRSLILGIIFGIFFKPRAWCQVCPMSTGSDKFKLALLKLKIIK